MAPRGWREDASICSLPPNLYSRQYPISQSSAKPWANEPLSTNILIEGPALLKFQNHPQIQRPFLSVHSRHSSVGSSCEVSQLPAPHSTTASPEHRPLPAFSNAPRGVSPGQAASACVAPFVCSVPSPCPLVQIQAQNFLAEASCPNAKPRPAHCTSRRSLTPAASLSSVPS